MFYLKSDLHKDGHLYLYYVKKGKQVEAHYLCLYSEWQ